MHVARARDAAAQLVVTVDCGTMYLRIQDHLRHVGLGRKALAVLMREHGLHRLDPPAPEQMPDFCHTQPGEAEMGAFERMFRSVRAGLGE